MYFFPAYNDNNNLTRFEFEISFGASLWNTVDSAISAESADFFISFFFFFLNPEFVSFA